MPTAAQLKAAKIREVESGLQLFNRVVDVIIAKQPTGFVGANPGFFETVGNAIEITDMRVQFEVKKSLSKTPNTATVTITNLSKATRTELETKPLYAILRAGYDGAPRLLFAGNVSFAFSKRNGTDWETKIQIADGLRAYAGARMSKTYQKPITVLQVIRDAAGSMGLKVPPEAEQDPALRQALAAGIVAHGNTRDQLTKILAPYGYGWSIQNGRLQILADEQVTATSAIVIDQEAGMINSPEHSVPAKPGDPSDLSFETLVYPEINPGGLVDLDAIATKGIYKVQDVTHKGDTRGDDWTTSCKALPLGQSKHKGRKR